MPFLDHYILFLWCERLGCGLPLGYIILLAEAEQLSQIIVLLTQHRQHRRCKCRSVRRNKDKKLAVLTGEVPKVESLLFGIPW